MYKNSPEIEDEVDGFLTDPSSNLQRVFQKLPKKRISDFREFAVDEAAREIKERLDVS